MIKYRNHSQTAGFINELNPTKLNFNKLRIMESFCLVLCSATDLKNDVTCFVISYNNFTALIPTFSTFSQ